ncbi:MAG TPA: hypothetical protein VMI56_02515 [Reyranella sp.]|nr:hypothetical protein [Reyranella sp.]
MRLAVLLALLMTWSSASFAQDLDALAKQPGFTVTKKIENGEEVVEIRKSTVTIRKTKDGTTGFDSSPHGAVGCAWMSYIRLKAAADYCYPDSHAELRQDLAWTVDRLKKFIVANEIGPITEAQLDAEVQRLADKWAKAPQRPAGVERCPKGRTPADWLSDLEQMGHEKFRADIDATLAEPRPPVNNPCF